MNPKAKGSGFERDIAKFLTEWLTGQSKEYYFWRSPASGGITTILEENGTIAGDIIALKPEATKLTNEYSIECKKGYPQSSFHKFIKTEKEDEISSFWKQACTAANKSKRLPMLFYHKTGQNILVGVPFHPPVSMKYITLFIPSAAYPLVHFYDMKQFFKYNKPKDFLPDNYTFDRT